MIKAVRYLDENLQMPPKNKKLSAEQISDLEAWVRMGARTRARTNSFRRISTLDCRAGTGRLNLNLQPSASHWAFQPVKKPPIPAVQNQRWIQTPVDQFVLAKLEEKAWRPRAGRINGL